jgi:hypothetical protein
MILLTSSKRFLFYSPDVKDLRRAKKVEFFCFVKLQLRLNDFNKFPSPSSKAIKKQ